MVEKFNDCISCTDKKINQEIDTTDITSTCYNMDYIYMHITLIAVDRFY